MFSVLCGIVGLMVGSFLNVVIHRLPKMLEQEWRRHCAELNGQPAQIAECYNLVVPRSACPHCGHRIGALENIPLLSYLLLRGKCKGCGAPISPRYPIVETLSGVLSAYAAWHFGFGMAACNALLFIWAMLVLTGIDFDTQLLPDSITLPLLWLGLLFNLSATFTDLHSAVIGAVAGYLALWSVYWLFKITTGKEGMGYGDFKLLAALGAWMGAWALLPVVLISSIVGAVIGSLYLALSRKGQGVPIPFGPYLAIAGWIWLLAGPWLTHWYFGFFMHG